MEMNKCASVTGLTTTATGVSSLFLAKLLHANKNWTQSQPIRKDCNLQMASIQLTRLQKQDTACDNQAWSVIKKRDGNHEPECSHV